MAALSNVNALTAYENSMTPSTNHGADLPMASSTMPPT